MSAGADMTMGLQTARDRSRRWLLIFASSATVFSVLIYTLILPAIYLAARGRDVAGYHLFVAITGLILLGTVHFAPTGRQESPIHDIHMVYERPLVGMLAPMNTNRPHDQRGAPGDNRLRGAA